MLGSLGGIISADVSGENCEKLLNSLKANGIMFEDCQYTGKCVRFSVKRKDFKRLCSISEKLGMVCTAGEKRGAYFAAAAYVKRMGVYIGVLCGLFLITILSNTALDIEIYGCQNVSEERILTALRNSGIKVGTFIPNVNFRKAERDIAIAEDELSWIGIRNIGCRVLVEVSETVYPPESVPSNHPCNVVAERDAQVVYAEVYNGELVPMLGEAVCKNDLLISGTCEGKYGNTRLVHASGKIIGRYTEKQVFNQPLTYIDRVEDETGNITQLYIGGVRLPLWGGRAPVSDDMEITEAENPFRFMNLTLPMGIVVSEYRPFHPEQITILPETAFMKIEDKINIFEQNFIESDDVQIIDKEIQRNLTDTEAEIVVKYTLEGNIGCEREIFSGKNDYFSSETP